MPTQCTIIGNTKNISILILCQHWRNGCWCIWSNYL